MSDETDRAIRRGRIIRGIERQEQMPLEQKIEFLLRRKPTKKASLPLLAAKIDVAAWATCSRAVTYIYFVRCMAFVKVGYSDNPPLRVQSLQYGNPFKIALLKVIKGTIAGEGAILELLSPYHHQFEWFHLQPELLEAIEALPGVPARQFKDAVA